MYINRQFCVCIYGYKICPDKIVGRDKITGHQEISFSIDTLTWLPQHLRILNITSNSVRLQID